MNPIGMNILYTLSRLKPHSCHLPSVIYHLYLPPTLGPEITRLAISWLPTQLKAFRISYTPILVLLRCRWAAPYVHGCHACRPMGKVWHGQPRRIQEIAWWRLKWWKKRGRWLNHQRLGWNYMISFFIGEISFGNHKWLDSSIRHGEASLSTDIG